MTIPQELVERVRGLTGPDREIDRDIHAEVDGWEKVWNEDLEFFQLWKNDKWIALGSIPSYTASIDAALALAERVLPGSMKRVFDNPDDGSVRAEIIHGLIYGKGDHDTWPLAIVFATLIATQSSETK